MKLQNIVYLIGGIFLILSGISTGVDISSIVNIYWIFGVIYILHVFNIIKMDKSASDISLASILISSLIFDFIMIYIKITPGQEDAAYILLFTYLFDLAAIGFIIRAILYGYVSKNLLDKKL